MRCSYGAIFDVIVDLRPGSPTYRNWESFELRDDRAGFAVRAGRLRARIPGAAPSRPTCPTGSIARTTRPRICPVAFDDPDLAIPWPLPVVGHVAPGPWRRLPLAAALELLA